MARDLELTITVNQQAAIAALHETDQAFDQTTVKAQTTAASVSTFNQTLEQGAVKTLAYQKQVVDVAAGIDIFSVSAVEADKYLSDLYVTTQKMPSVLSEMRTGLNDVATGAGLTVESLGALRSAGLLVAAGFAGWKIGGIINDLTGLDKGIGNVTQATRDWISGSETMGARADTLAIASQRAGRAVTDFSEALKVNQEWLDQWQKTATEADNTVSRLKAPEASRKSFADWNAEIQKVRRDGVLEELTKDIDSHAFSMKELAERYRISQDAIREFMRQLEAERQAYASYYSYRTEMEAKIAADNKKADAEKKRATEEIKAVTADVTKEYENWLSKHDAIVTKMREEAILAEFQAKQKNMAQYGVDENGAPLSLQNDPLMKAQRDREELQRKSADPALRGISTSQREQQINDTFLKSQLDEAKAADAASGALKTVADTGKQVSTTHQGAARAGDMLIQSFSDGAIVVQNAVGTFRSSLAPNDPGYFGRGTQASVARTLYGDGTGYTPTEAATIAAGIPINFAAGNANRRAAGGPTTAGQTYMVGEKGPELWTAGSDGNVTPNSAIGGVGAIHVTINGNVDSRATADRLAAQTADLVFQRMQRERKVPLGKR